MLVLSCSFHTISSLAGAWDGKVTPQAPAGEECVCDFGRKNTYIPQVEAAKALRHAASQAGENKGIFQLNRFPSSVTVEVVSFVWGWRAWGRHMAWKKKG